MSRWRFLVFVGALAVLVGRGLTEKTVFIQKNRSAYLIVENSTKSQCYVETNVPEKNYDYEPMYRKIGNNSNLHSVDNTCTIEILRPSMSDVGTWKIVRYEQDENVTYPFRVYYAEVATIFPTDFITVFKGYYINARIHEQFEKIEGCNVTDPQGNTFDILEGENPDVKRFDQCGVRVLANSTAAGKWVLTAIIDNTTVYIGDFKVDVKEETRSDNKQREIFHLKRGTSSTIKMDYESSNLCQFTDPHGIKTAFLNSGLKATTCNLKIPIVTAYHEGLWTVRYGLRGKVDLVERNFTVVTYDSDILITDVNVVKNEKIELLCRVRVEEVTNMKYCLFFKPNGTPLHITVGVGNDRYSYYGGKRSEDSKNYVTCGLIVRRPQTDDYGVWKCQIGINSDNYTSLLITSASSKVLTDDLQDIRIRAEEVEVKRGDSFKIKCNANAVLNYCWLRSPNGTNYFVTRNEKSLSQNILLYNGLGLSSGECGAIIEKSDDTHRGTWTCSVGIANGIEMESTVLVTVADSYILAENEKVLADDSSQPCLRCHILRSSVDRTINYCRWIRPDGRGIYNGIKHQYTTTWTDSSCELTILDKDFKVNEGRWTCVAMLSGYGNEVQASVHLHYRESTVLITSVVIATIVGVCILVSFIILRVVSAIQYEYYRILLIKKLNNAQKLTQSNHLETLHPNYKEFSN